MQSDVNERDEEEQGGVDRRDKGVHRVVWAEGIGAGVQGGVDGRDKGVQGEGDWRDEDSCLSSTLRYMTFPAHSHSSLFFTSFLCFY